MDTLIKPIEDNNKKDSNNDIECIKIDEDNTIHPFNLSTNITIIEKKLNHNHCEGSDSGVEVAETIYQPHQEQQSCDSSIISCCSNYEEAYNLLVRRNSTLLDDYKLRHVDDGNSENGSESSSITGSSSSRHSARNNNIIKKNHSQIINKKKVPLNDGNNKIILTNRNNNRPPQTPKNKTETARLKSIDRLQGKNVKRQTPTNLDINKRHNNNNNTINRTPRTPSNTRTPVTTPTDDGRWPSINSKPAPLLSKSIRGNVDNINNKISKSDSKTIETYATLPRRKKSSDELKKSLTTSTTTSSSSSTTITTPSTTGVGTFIKKTSVRMPLKKKIKIKIYHEIGQQTALTMNDVERALSGVLIGPIDLRDCEKCDKDVQVDMRLKDIEQLQNELKQYKLKYENLTLEYKKQNEKLYKTETQLNGEILEKNSLQEELNKNCQRVLSILGESNLNDDEKVTSDSLMVLESRFQNVSQVVIRQEEEISKLNSHCRSLQIELEKTMATQNIMIKQQNELEMESVELQEFMQAEKITLSDALWESETEIAKLNNILMRTKKELKNCKEECQKLHKVGEEKWQENLGLQAKLGAIEAKSRDLLVQQGSSVSGAAVALSALIGRLEGLVDELVSSYNISEQELEDVIFHNEAYSNSSSSPDVTPEKAGTFIDKIQSPKKGSSFVSAVINAIKNAAAQSPFAGNKEYSKENSFNDQSSSNEMLDSETEPCLMMEHVLEDVVIPDGHSHNMISSCHSLLNHSSSLKDLSQRNKQMSTSLTTSFNSETPSITDIYPSLSLIDQVIDVDNLVTRLLKVIRIIQLENEDCMNELYEQRNNLQEQVNKQKETNKFVVKQLKDWETLGARLKAEVKELMNQLCKKNHETDNIKQELNNQREQVEKLSQDVCELSTALSRAEFEKKTKEDEMNEDINNLDNINESPTTEKKDFLLAIQKEVPILKEKLAEKERQLKEITQEYLASSHLLTESLKVAVNEAKKQYEAIDGALDVLHANQSIVQQCKALADLQRELENTNFQSASIMPLTTPPDCNANAAALVHQALTQIASPINTTA